LTVQANEFSGSVLFWRSYFLFLG